jgi:phosphoribosyl 1,2-cyclic phosphodiesterase
MPRLGASLSAEFTGRALDCLFYHFHWDHTQSLAFFSPLYEAATDVTFHSAKLSASRGLSLAYARREEKFRRPRGVVVS